MSFVDLNVAVFGAADAYARRDVDVAVVALSSLPVGHAWRVDGLDDARVAALAAIYPKLPAVLVRRHDLLVVDGAHTVAAARRLGMQTAHVQWFDGTWVDAAEAFVLRNSTEVSLPLTLGDRRRLIESMLRAEPTWSDRRIAEVCGVSPKVIARSRSDESATQPTFGAEKRIGRDGRARPIRAGAMRSSIEQMLEQQPDASLRTIASALGVSPETVRSVRRDREVGSDVAERPGRHPATVVGHDVVRRPIFREVPAPWREDNAFSSTNTGAEFVDWFEATNVGSQPGRPDLVPLSRIYEIADEARRRAAYWTDFAEELERRARHRR